MGVSVLRGQGVGLPTVKVPFWPGVRNYSAGFTLDTYTHITNDMQRGAAEKIGGFMEMATAKPMPEPTDPPEESRCKVIPFERIG